MEKYEKLFKGLELCAGPECSTECPYHGETRGGKTCRAWLLNDAAVALAGEMNRVDKRDGEVALLNAQLRDKECAYSALAARFKDQQKTCDELRAANGILCEDTEKSAPGVMNMLEDAACRTNTFRVEAAYWHGQADALKWYLHDRFEDAAAEGAEPVDWDAVKEVTGNV